MGAIKQYASQQSCKTKPEHDGADDDDSRHRLGMRIRIHVYGILKSSFTQVTVYAFLVFATETLFHFDVKTVTQGTVLYLVNDLSHERILE